MQYQQLGNTGTFVSRLCLGTMTFGSGKVAPWDHIGNSSQKEANQIVATALDAGINFFDTADIYQTGESEVILGKALGKRRRETVIATKLHGRTGPGPNNVGQSRVHIMQALEDSLRRLETDYIDLYQIHGFDPITPFEESLRTFDDAIRQGKIRYIGCSNLAAWQIMKALGISENHGWERFVSVQAYYSLVGRDIEREIVPLLADQKLALLTWSPLAGGFLSGKFSRENDPKDESRRVHFNFPPINLDYAYNVIDSLKKVAMRHQTSVARIALAWELHQPFVTSVIIGARRLDQLQDDLQAVGLQLTSDDLSELNTVSRLPVEYPSWMQNMVSDRRPATGRLSAV